MRTTRLLTLLVLAGMLAPATAHSQILEFGERQEEEAPYDSWLHVSAETGVEIYFVCPEDSGRCGMSLYLPSPRTGLATVRGWIMAGEAAVLDEIEGLVPICMTVDSIDDETIEHLMGEDVCLFAPTDVPNGDLLYYKSSGFGVLEFWRLK